MIAKLKAGVAVFALTLALLSVTPAASDVKRSDTSFPGFTLGSAGEPRLAVHAFSPAPLYKNPDAVGDVRPPTELSGHVLYGLIRLGGTRAYVISGEYKRGYKLWWDSNGNGDLSDEAPLAMTLVGQLLEVTLEYGDQPTPLKLALDVDENGQPTAIARQYLWTERWGQLNLDGRSMIFVLTGNKGRYDHSSNAVFFDLSADGAIDTTDSYSSEKVTIETGHVTIDGISYRFEVDPHGATISLTALDQQLPQPPSLDPGALAPDFSFRDLAGLEHRLSEYRGRILLLYFWGTWCPPCTEDTPELVRAYAAFKDKGFEIIGINRRDDLESILAYTKHHNIEWIQSIQGEDGPILELYRVGGYPMSFLIDRGGRIFARPIRARDLRASLESIIDLKFQP